MPTQAQTLGTAIAAAGLGFVAGVVFWPKGEEPPKRAAPVERTLVKDNPKTEEALRVATSRLEACDDELSDAQDLLELVVAPFPDGPEQPEAWSSMLAKVMTACDVAPFEVGLVECSEYPCVAGLRPIDADDDDWMPAPGSARFEQRAALGSAIRSCPVLSEAFGTALPEGAVALAAHEAKCGEPFWSLFILDPKAEAFAFVMDDEVTAREQEQLERWASARTGALAQRWPCRE